MRVFILILMTMTFVGQASAEIVVGSKNLGNIWVIGDSITQGDSTGSFRSDLYNLLSTDHYTFGFTGHWDGYSAGLPTGYQYHSGVSGALIQSNYNGRTGIEQNIGSWWNQGQLATAKPNVILLMIGTNDIYLNLDAGHPTDAANRLSSLIQSLFTLAGNKVSIFVAGIPPQGTSNSVVVFNNAISGIVDSCKASGKDIHYVDMYTPLNSDYSHLMSSDNLHPNAAGNAVIAATWMSAINAATVPEPSTMVMLATGLAGLLAYTWRKRIH
jgi:lysophospholipase L1-like esterase